MDTTYSVNRNNRNFKWPIILLGLAILLGGVGYLIFGKSSNFISPLPETPAVEIISYTPTPEPVTPTSSPSATPKSAKKPTATATPKKDLTATPTKTVTATPTNKP